MKQFAIAFAAILATSTYAMEGEMPFMMTIAYDSHDDAYLGVEQGKTVKLMMPKQPMIGPMSKMGLNCTGW